MANIKIVNNGDVRFNIWYNNSEENESKGISLKSGLQSNGCVHCTAGLPIDLFGQS